MVGNIICPEQITLTPFDPSQYFDPTTNTCTEADFITILEHGCYDSSLIGKFVTLSNSVNYNGGKWVIADVNHDSANTGQSNCYDLISVDCLYSINYSDSNSNQWRNSNPRTWLNNTFYPGFSTDIKSHIMNIKYNSQGTWYTDDKIILPSYNEVNGGTSIYQDNEGVAYPIFTDSSSRIKYAFGTTSANYWWTRSRNLYESYRVWYVYTNGDVYNTGSITNYYNPVPILRVQ